MPSSTVNIGKDRIETTVTDKDREINRLLKTFLSNSNNTKNIIGVDIERVPTGRKQNRTALLQLCNGDNCLIIKFPGVEEDDDDDDDEDDVTLSLFNFFNLPHFTFVGVGINKTMMKLESEFGLICKNVVDVGPASWNVANMTGPDQSMLSDIVSTERPSDVVFDNWDKPFLNKKQIKLAVANAHFAFSLGNILLMTGLGF